MIVRSNFVGTCLKPKLTINQMVRALAISGQERYTLLLAGHLRAQLNNSNIEKNYILHTNNRAYQIERTVS